MARFQTFWAGDPLTPYEAMCLRSFVDFGHDVQVFSYDKNLSVPGGAQLLDAAQILPESAYFESESPKGDKSPSAFSDLFRWTLLYQRGGWWIDTDVVCLRRDLPDFELFFAEESAGKVASGVVFAPAGHAMVKACAEAAAKAPRPVPWGSIGPALITATVKSLGLSDHLRPSSLCFPIHWSDALDVLLPEKEPSVRDRTKSALFLHLWNQVLLRNAIDKFCLPPEGSFLRSVARNHEVNGWRSELNEDLVRAKSDLIEAQKLSREQFAALRIELRTAKSDLKRSKAEIKELRSALRQAQSGIAAAHNSLSWRATRPLRRVARALRSAYLKATQR